MKSKVKITVEWNRKKFIINKLPEKGYQCDKKHCCFFNKEICVGDSEVKIGDFPCEKLRDAIEDHFGCKLPLFTVRLARS